MKKITLLIATLTLSVGSIFAQGSNTIPSNNHSQTSTYDRVETSTERCSTDEVMKALRDKDPIAYDAQEALKEQQYQDWIKNEYPKFKSSKKAVITIPVVVQIWETTGTVPDTRVTQQINRLNLDFRGANSDISNTPSVFPTADSEIEFCLATIDPNGNPTTGIIRRTAGGSPPQSGGTEMWDPTRYLNIYVYNIGGGTLGFTYLSSQSPNQAVHITTSAFGNAGGQFGMGRTATHEIGHWLNLKHIWGDNNCGNDNVNDTPPAQSANYNCPSHPHDVGVCSGNTNGEMFMNYMDYVNDACMYAFTPGQKARMIAAINNDRPGLLTSNGCQATGLTANFTANNTTITAGQTVTFTYNSSGPNPITSWSWNFDVNSQGGVSPSTASTQGPHTVTYNNAGTYTVRLTVGDGSSNDTETKNAYITVLQQGTQVCDSTAANWDFAQHASQTGAYQWDNNGGFAMGQNSYGDNGWADKVPYTGSGTFLTDVLMYFRPVGSGNVNLKVWNVAGNGAPNSVLAQQTVQISQLGSGGTTTLWTLPSPVSLNGNFFVGHDHNTLVNGDTVALMSAPTSTPSVWAKETTGWKALSSYNFNHSGAIIPVICNTVTGEKELLKDINDILVFPNPTNGTLNVALTAKENTSVDIYNIVGKLIYSSGIKNTQLFTIDINNQPNGVYFVNIKSGNSVTTKKVLLSK